MKSGQVPIHIMRWAPSDFVNDLFVKKLVSREDFATLSFYNLALNWSHIEGGDLPSDPEELAILLGMKRKVVEKALQICVAAGKLVVEGARVFHPRVVREVARELEFRRNQSEAGKKGGRPALDKVVEGKPKATLSKDKGSEKGSQSPPSPTPSASALRLPPAPEVESATKVESGELKPPLLDEAKCPDCGVSGTLRRQRDGNGWFCGTKLGGCSAMFEINEPAITKQLSERAKDSIRARVVRQQPDAPTPEVVEQQTALGTWLEKDGRSTTQLAESFLDWIAKSGRENEPEGLLREQWRKAIGAPVGLGAVLSAAIYHEHKKRSAAKQVPA